MVGYPDGLFRGGRPSSRYEMGSALHRLYVSHRNRLEGIRRNNESPRTIASQRPLDEFRQAMAALQRDIEGLKAQRAEVGEITRNMRGLRQELDRLRGNMDEMRKSLGSTRARVRG